LKEAILANVKKIDVITEASVPKTNPLVQEVMQKLDESGSGSI
jgi:4-hydroxy-3-methylbut-2-enyl diphosphate reductase IspH